MKARKTFYFAKLVRNQTGQIIAFAIIMIVAIIGILGLSLEIGRYRLLNSQLQDLADAAALAGARELDGQTGAIIRAKNAAEDVSQRNPHWWSNLDFGADPHIEYFEFYSNLRCVPTCDVTPDDIKLNEASADADEKARFIRVRTTPGEVWPAFLNVARVLSAFGAIENKQTNATATAGTTNIACKVQPLMMCDPFPSTTAAGHTPGKPMNTVDDRGRMFRLKGVGGNSLYAPGAFGLLDPPNVGNAGATLIRNNLAAKDPPFCFTNNISVRTGEAMGPVNVGINTRFDEFPQNFPSEIQVAPPKVNIKGLKTPGANKCNFQDAQAPSDGGFRRLPRDSSFKSTEGGTSVGDKNWTSMFAPYDPALPGPGGWEVGYWDRNHGTTIAPAIPDLEPGQNPTRFDYYRMELGVDVDGKSTYTPIPFTTPFVEDPTALCWNQKTDSWPSEPGLDRRIIYVSIIDADVCSTLHGTNVPLVNTRVAKFFLTEPMTPAPDNEIVGEFLEISDVGGGKGYSIHRIVQLYRDVPPP